jgi:hypothetical protein
MNQKSKKYFEKLKIHLPIAKDPTVVILRGHLLIEELLNDIISFHLKDPSAIKDARLTFFQKMRLAQGILGNKKDNSTWKAIEVLNKLRNQISHRLPDSTLINQMNPILKAIFEDEFDQIPSDIYSKSKALRKGIIFHCAMLSGMIEGMLEVKKHIAE